VVLARREHIQADVLGLVGDGDNRLDPLVLGGGPAGRGIGGDIADFASGDPNIARMRLQPGNIAFAVTCTHLQHPLAACFAADLVSGFQQPVLTALFKPMSRPKSRPMSRPKSRRIACVSGSGTSATS
jgi:hypothetical protein